MAQHRTVTLPSVLWIRSTNNLERSLRLALRGSKRVLLSPAHALVQLLVTLFFVILEAFNLWGVASLTGNTTRLSGTLYRLMAKPWMRQSRLGQFLLDHIIPRIRQNSPLSRATDKILRLILMTDRTS